MSGSSYPPGSESPIDDVGHGTKVSGIALYGDIGKCIDNKDFSPDLWIFSAKVMFRDEDGYATFNEDELLENQLENAVKWIRDNYSNCKLVNISFGDEAKRMIEGRRQFNLAAHIDELANRFSLIFVVATGNISRQIIEDWLENYPDYLIEDVDNLYKIADPASSALAITVGGLSKHSFPRGLFEETAFWPSPITRVGPGYQGMIKPEFVELSGGGFGDETDVITLNPNWIDEGRLFTLDFGTSFSTPKVAHMMGKLFNSYPTASNNLIKGLLLSSAKIPNNRPNSLSSINYNSSNTEQQKLYNLYGFGKPSLNEAIYSSENRVILLRENNIKLNQINIYPFFVPQEFINERGERYLSVVLVFNPPINKNRVKYFGVTMEALLFKNLDSEQVAAYLSTQDTVEEDIVIPQNLRRNQINLSPGITLRKKSVHQKGTIKYVKKPSIDYTKPLNLVIVCKNNWIKDTEYLQEYATLVSIEHSASVDLYNRIGLRIPERIQISLDT